MRPPMSSKLSVLVFVHVDVEAADRLTNSSRLQRASDVTSEILEHRIWIEVSLSKSMLSPDEAYGVPMFFSQDDSAGGSHKPTL